MQKQFMEEMRQLTLPDPEACPPSEVSAWALVALVAVIGLTVGFLFGMHYAHTLTPVYEPFVHLQWRI